MVKALILIVVCDLHSRKGDSEGGVRKGDYKVINMVEINSVMGKVKEILGLMGLPLTARFPVGKPVVPAALTWS